MRLRLILVGAGLTVLAIAGSMLLQRPARRQSATSGPALVATSREGIDGTIARARLRVAADPGDGASAILLSDALMRAARVRSDATLAGEAERVLRSALAHGPSDYLLQRMLGVVYLSQHRFAEALTAAEQARAVRPEDAWNYAVAGDALLELGRYEEAFDAFDAVMARRPDAAAYARVAYARELQGDLDGAVRLMGMAAESTSPHDVEARAWTFAQIGHLHLQQHKLQDAEREFNRAEFTFPGHPYASAGRIRLHIARGEYRQALRLVEQIAETPESRAMAGDLQAYLGDRAAAEQSYQRAESLERDGWKYEQPQPAALARFLAERQRDIPTAVSLAEQAAGERQDIHTLDALAWAYFRAGRFEDAAAAIRRATRTGTVDPRIRCHEAAISAVAHQQPDHVCDPLSVLAGHDQAIRWARRAVEPGERR
jgi:tetratricopeptide (TPR) repeat protein